MHTKLPWGQHPAYVNNVPFAFHHDGDELVTYSITIASGEKLIGQLEMYTGSKGHVRVDNAQEVRDNAAFLFNAVNSHDALVVALSDLIDAADGFNVSGVYFNEIDFGKAALAKACTALNKAMGK